jgi:hypothetical protein
MCESVYIVHCIDTEGPLYESLYATFERVKDIYGIDIQPTAENLKKLQDKELNVDGYEDAIADMVSPKRIKTNETWDQIDVMLNELLSDEYRKKLVDSIGNGWVYNWFCMDHVGFTGYNPRRRDAGYHNIYDHYLHKLKEINNDKDLIQFHYHPLPFSGDYNISATAYLNSNNIFDILCRKVIDREWFPSTFRPGFHTERPDSHWFLEQWIPFDYANQATNNIDDKQIDLSNGRYGDWRRAPKEWIPYHPSHDDYQVEGTSRRWIARCLNMEARIRELTLNDVIEGFERAKSGKPAIIAFTNHDFRDMRPEVDKVREMISEVSKNYKDVKFYYSNAIDAMRNTLKLQAKKIDLKIELKKDIDKNTAFLKIKSNNKIFGPQPFLAIKTVTGQYIWDNLDFQSEKEWTYTFDANTLKLNMLEKIGVAANSSEGVTEVIVYDVHYDKKVKRIYNE